MIRTLLRSALAVAMIAGASLVVCSRACAQENCPNCPGGDGIDGHDGHGHQHGHQPVGGYPPAYNRAAYDEESVRDYAGHGGCRTCSNGQCQYRFYGQPDLFYNYYAWPSCTGQGAEMYLCPRPVPPLVGNTYITYQPLYPNEFLYTHFRTYHRYYNGGQGLDRTAVHYHHSLFGN